MDTFLTGAGHFGFGFIVGSLLFILLVMSLRKSFFIQVYTPFLPFLLGLMAIVPYSFLPQQTCSLPLVANAFLFYSWAHCHAGIIQLLGNLHLVVLVCGVIYCFIVLRYISLVKRVRRYGWPKKRGA